MSNKVNKSISQFIRFGIVGLSNTAINYAVFALLVYLGVQYLVSNFIAFSISVVNSYYWNNRHVFMLEAGQSRSRWKTFMKTYAAYSLTGIILCSILLWLWVDVVGLSEYVAACINIPISVPINFFVNKYWAYRPAG